MSYLLAISVGPVQEFIAAARRTRDLWFGSYLLSEISKAVAKFLKENGNELIFPPPETDLSPDNDRVNVANVILASFPQNEPMAIVKMARHAAQKRWEEFAKQAREDAQNAIPNDGSWEKQLGDVIEFYAARVEQTDNYPADRKRLMRILAGRKNCHDFKSQSFNDAGLPKSSLDGQRASVLAQAEYRNQREHLRKSWPVALRLSSGEELDVIGVTKRLGKKPGEPHPSYASVARVAADPWLRGIQKHPLFGELKSACDSVLDLNRVRNGYGDFPFEGTVVFQSRHADLEAELKEDSHEPLRKVREVLNKFGSEPSPYFAVLVADGDKMGEVISLLPDAKANQNFSTALAGFANEARTITTAHNGILVYAGGDDVLAFLPVDRCLACARKLHDTFRELLKKYMDKKGKPPTLSVGLAVAHFMENLEDLLQYGRDAEKAAKKPDRDGLAVHLHKRSGGAPVHVRSQWAGNPDELLTRLAKFIQSGTLPRKLPYDLHRLVDHYQGWKHNSESEKQLLLGAMQQDVIRVIRDKQPRSGKQDMPEVEKIVKNFASLKDLEQFTKQLLVAQHLVVSQKPIEEGEK